MRRISDSRDACAAESDRSPSRAAMAARAAEKPPQSAEWMPWLETGSKDSAESPHAIHPSPVVRSRRPPQASATFNAGSNRASNKDFKWRVAAHATSQAAGLSLIRLASAGDT